MCTRLVAANGFAWSKPQRPTEEYADEEEGDNLADVGSDIEDELGANSDGDDVMYTELVREAVAAKQDDELEKSQAGIIKSAVDPVLWQTELERVGPRLHSSQARGAKEWRGHIEQTKKHEETIAKYLPDSQAQIEQIAAHISSVLERMTAKEKFINNQFEHLVSQAARPRQVPVLPLLTPSPHLAHNTAPVSATHISAKTTAPRRKSSLP